jgi:hypothetical protein
MRLKQFLGYMILFLSSYAGFSMEPKRPQPSKRPSFAIAPKNSILTDVEIEQVGYNRQLTFERRIEFSDGEDMDSFFEELSNKTRLGTDILYKKQATDCWTVEDLNTNLPVKQRLKKWRLRMENNELKPLSPLSKRRGLHVENTDYYPSFRTSFIEDFEGGIIITEFGKFANLLVVYSPSGKSGRYNKTNLQNNLIVLNIHLYFLFSKKPAKNPMAQFENILDEFYEKREILSKFFSAPWPIKPKFSISQRGNSAFRYENKEHSWLSQLGYDSATYVLLTDEYTYSNFLNWR